jgi:Skp family chaperone for outer membrane proteins
MGRIGAWIGCLVLAAAGAMAQSVPETPAGATGQSGVTVRSPILTIDPDHLFQSTELGQRITRDLRQRELAQAEENRVLAEALTAEERALTELRATLSPEDFRIEADAFDQKAQEIRVAQDAKERELQRLQFEERDRFLSVVQPVLGAIMFEHGAVVIVDRRSVFMSAGVVDITDEAVARIDAEIGQGTVLDTAQDTAQDAGNNDN